MASTIKVNNIQNQCGANIANKCGTTVTLGASGDTITLACGASQTGFGRTGTVDWDTTAKTASFTAVSGNGYFVNTTSGAITVTLPATPSAGDIIALSDYAGTAATNNITIARNGSNIEGLAENPVINSTREARTYVYVDGTQGWVPVNTNDSATIPPAYVTATGGTITCCGDYKIHTFTGPGTFTVTCAGNSLGSNTVDYLVVAGAGGAGGSAPGAGGGSGGGAGGYRESSGATSGCYTASPLGACVSALPVNAQAYPITVGSGGTPGPGTGPLSCRNGGDGNNSIFSTIIATAGGAGKAGPCGSQDGNPGGSGGGASGGGPGCRTGGSGNTPPVSPPQGNPGGDTGANDATPERYDSAGGGGATTAGSNAQPGPRAGGTGATTNISGSPFTKSAGGDGGSYPSSGPDAVSGPSGAANSGDGGTGATNAPGAPGATTGGAGGSGIVIIRYKFQ
jgi:hypothetical protein